MLMLRTATAADLPILLDLYADMDGHEALNPAQGAELFDAIQQVPDYNIYLISENGTTSPIGTFSLLEIPTFMHRGYHKSALLDAVSIRSSHRGQGYGTAMIHLALQQARESGCYKVTLSTNLDRPAAHSFYQQLGFKQHGWSYSCIL